MRCSIAYCYYLAGWWEDQIEQRRELAPFMQEGLTAYAKEHAHVERKRGMAWSCAWSEVRAHSRKVLEYLLDAKHGELPNVLAELEVELDMDDDKKGDEFDNEDDDDD
ncbi:hypothetical protein V5O48_012423 [Marasmius crinis-equi]|uniref:Uncharacterized protein n=1 Tax=Marasmius crinis-equi TaxID=585013 RepID=A0ABR3F341_9AGAR